METKENNNTASTHQEKARKLKKLRRWQIVVSLLGIAILIWGIIQVVCLFLNYKRTETSNDAQIEQYISPVNLRASGYIKKICFTEHQEVHKGDTLLILDDREYKIRVMEAEAALKLSGNVPRDFAVFSNGTAPVAGGDQCNVFHDSSITSIMIREKMIEAPI